jgi:hypothetical protein
VQQVTVVQEQTTPVPAIYTPIPSLLTVNPAGGLVSGGYAGGPFSPPSITYALSNSGASVLTWAANKTAHWLSLSASGGILAGGARTNVTVAINPEANGLAAGGYTNTVGFTNLTSGLGSTTRQVMLAVAAQPPISLGEPRVLGGGRVAMTLHGVTNRVYSIMTSSNLLDRATNWAEVLRLTNAAGQTRFTNPLPAATPQRFYRAKEP